MIIKGKSRGGASQLARHLLRADTNERVKLIELQSPLDDLGDALRDWQLISTGTKGQKGLYHANISPDNYVMTDKQWLRCVEVLETELGFTGQPRTIVLHEKEGREHIHVVWQRTDIDTMTLKSDSQNYQAHERASMTLEEEFGHELVPGKHAKRDREQQPEFPRAKYNLDEAQQFERNNIDPEQFKITLTEIYRQSDTARAFKAALEDNGLILATGDKRGFVLVDQEGEVYSLSRQLLDVKAKELKKFLKNIGQIEDVEQATARQEFKNHLRDILPEHWPKWPEPEQTPEPKPQQKPEQKKAQAPQPDKQIDPQAQKLEVALKARNDQQSQEILERHLIEMQRLKETHKADTDELLAARRAVQQAELARFYQREAEHSDDWVKKFADIVKHRWNPAAAEQQRLERQQKIDEIRTRHRIERETLIQTRKIQRDSDLEELKHRHSQQLQEQAIRQSAERERYKREQDAGMKIFEQIMKDEQKRQEERKQKPDEPDPPKRSL